MMHFAKTALIVIVVMFLVNKVLPASVKAYIV